MTVTVRLFAILRQGRFREERIGLPEGASLSELLQRLDIAGERVGILLVNGVRTDPGRLLAHDDVVAVFPALGGG